MRITHRSVGATKPLLWPPKRIRLLVMVVRTDDDDDGDDGDSDDDDNGAVVAVVDDDGDDNGHQHGAGVLAEAGLDCSWWSVKAKRAHLPPYPVLGPW